MTLRDTLVYAFLAIVWGLSFLVFLNSVQAFGWIGAVTFRCFIASGTILLLARFIGRRLDFSAGWKHFAVVGATTVVAQLIGMSYAMPHIGTAMAAIIVATIPLFSMIIGQMWGLERIGPQGALGLGVGIVGIVFLVGFPAVPVTADFLVGCATAFFSSISAAYGTNYASRNLRNTGSWEITSGAFLLGGFMTLPLILLVPVPTIPNAVDYLYLIISGCVMSALTYVLYFQLVSNIGATKALSVEFVVTVIAVLIGALWLNEPLSLLQLAGALVIIAGCLMVLGIFPRGPRSPVT